ncbi:hypothetical protein NGA35_02425 [Pseudomonas stutzeri]|nr:hypothetical protein [Stutzerimonas stutzeri]
MLDIEALGMRYVDSQAQARRVVGEGEAFLLARIGSAAFGMGGSGAEHLRAKNGRLHMCGRQKPQFASSKAPGRIRDLPSAASVQPGDSDAFLLHRGGAALVDATAHRFSDEKSSFVLDMRRTGSTVPSILPLLLEKNRDLARRQVLLCGFGAGLSWDAELSNRAPGKATGHP